MQSQTSPITIAHNQQQLADSCLTLRAPSQQSNNSADCAAPPKKRRSSKPNCTGANCWRRMEARRTAAQLVLQHQHPINSILPPYCNGRNNVIFADLAQQQIKMDDVQRRLERLEEIDRSRSAELAVLREEAAVHFAVNSKLCEALVAMERRIHFFESEHNALHLQSNERLQMMNMAHDHQLSCEVFPEFPEEFARGERSANDGNNNDEEKQPLAIMNDLLSDALFRNNFSSIPPVHATDIRMDAAVEHLIQHLHNLNAKEASETDDTADTDEMKQIYYSVSDPSQENNVSSTFDDYSFFLTGDACTSSSSLESPFPRYSPITESDLKLASAFVPDVLHVRACSTDSALSTQASSPGPGGKGDGGWTFEPVDHLESDGDAVMHFRHMSESPQPRHPRCCRGERSFSEQSDFNSIAQVDFDYNDVHKRALTPSAIIVDAVPDVAMPLEIQLSPRQEPVVDLVRPAGKEATVVSTEARTNKRKLKFTPITPAFVCSGTFEKINSPVSVRPPAAVGNTVRSSFTGYPCTSTMASPTFDRRVLRRNSYANIVGGKEWDAFERILLDHQFMPNSAPFHPGGMPYYRTDIPPPPCHFPALPGAARTPSTSTSPSTSENRTPLSTINGNPSTSPMNMSASYLQATIRGSAQPADKPTQRVESGVVVAKPVKSKSQNQKATTGKKLNDVHEKFPLELSAHVQSLPEKQRSVVEFPVARHVPTRVFLHDGMTTVLESKKDEDRSEPQELVIEKVCDEECTSNSMDIAMEVFPEVENTSPPKEEKSKYQLQKEMKEKRKQMKKELLLMSKRKVPEKNPPQEHVQVEPSPTSNNDCINLKAHEYDDLATKETTSEVAGSSLAALRDAGKESGHDCPTLSSDNLSSFSTKVIDTEGSKPTSRILPEPPAALFDRTAEKERDLIVTGELVCSNATTESNRKRKARLRKEQEDKIREGKEVEENPKTEEIRNPSPYDTQHFHSPLFTNVLWTIVVLCSEFLFAIVERVPFLFAKFKEPFLMVHQYWRTVVSGATVLILFATATYGGFMVLTGVTINGRPDDQCLLRPANSFTPLPACLLAESSTSFEKIRQSSPSDYKEFPPMPSVRNEYEQALQNNKDAKAFMMLRISYGHMEESYKEKREREVFAKKIAEEVENVVDLKEEDEEFDEDYNKKKEADKWKVKKKGKEKRETETKKSEELAWRKQLEEKVKNVEEWMMEDENCVFLDTLTLIEKPNQSASDSVLYFLEVYTILEEDMEDDW